MAKTFIARWKGEIVGTRKSDRDYKVAVITQRNEEMARADAYDRSPTKRDVSDFEWFSFVARCSPLQPSTFKNHSYALGFTEEEIGRAKARVAGGIEGYVERRVARDIDAFEAMLKRGCFNPEVARWSLSESAARRAIPNLCPTPMYAFLGIVPAEVKP